MKKSLIIAGLACVALAACTKNEVVSVAPDQEITFQTIETKAASGFTKTNIFKSYAYFLEKGKAWDANYTSASAYISGSDIKFQSGANAWKADKVYYWPKQGRLTFFAWSMNDIATPTITGATEVASPAAKGITVTKYDITQNKNRDFLVAEVAKDQTMNTTNHTEGESGEGGTAPWNKGVPTVFKHALSSLAFTVQTVDGSGDPKDYSTEGVTFKVKSIKLTGIETTADYSQDWQVSTAASLHTWSNYSASNTIDVFTNASGQEATSTSTALTVGENDYTIVIPQEFTTEALEIVYTITTSYTGDDVTETVEYSTAKGNAIDLKTKIYTENWKPGYRYTVAIKLSMDEILWDPTIEEWETGTTQDITL